jgi:hypothetical protein
MLALKNDITINKKFKKDLSYIIPVEQQNTKLINAILIVKPNLKTVCFMIYRLGVLIWLSMLILKALFASSRCKI